MHSCEDPEGAEAGGVPAWLPDCLLCQAQIQLNTGAEILSPMSPRLRSATWHWLVMI